VGPLEGSLGGVLWRCLLEGGAPEVCPPDDVPWRWSHGGFL
jgi:hypothetical protein